MGSFSRPLAVYATGIHNACFPKERESALPCAKSDHSDRNLAKKIDKNTGKAVNYEYDSLGHLIRSHQSNGSSVVQRTEHIYDTTTGSTAASYVYDAWGNVISSSGTMASINPIRYRGYYYDTETGLYYLGSRYYDPAVKRFVNADRYASTGQGFVGYNMFAYCLNNPVCYYDSAGDYALPHEDKYVHDQLLGDICASNSDLSMHLSLIKYTDDVGLIKGRYGFCDLYNTKTGEVWELKKLPIAVPVKQKNASFKQKEKTP